MYIRWGGLFGVEERVDDNSPTLASPVPEPAGATPPSDPGNTALPSRDAALPVTGAAEPTAPVTDAAGSQPDPGVIIPTGSSGFRSLGQVVGINPDATSLAPTNHSGRVTIGAPTNRPKPSRQSALRQRAWLIAAAVVAVLVIAVIAIMAWYLNARSNTASLRNGHSYATTSVPLSDLHSAELAIDQAAQLSINGQLRINNSFILTPTNTPANPLLGQFYLNNQNNNLYFFNGFQFVQLATNTDTTNLLSSINGLGALSRASVGGGLSLQGDQLVNTGVTGLTGTANQVNVSGATGTINLSLPQDIAVSSTPTFTGLRVSTLFAGSAAVNPITVSDVGGTICTSVNNCNYVTSSTTFVQGGNSFGATAVLGTKDNNPLVLKTNNTDKLYIGTNGDVGIGTNGPGSKLDVQGGDINTSGKYLVGGSQISSADLSNNANLAKVNVGNTFTANNIFDGTVAIQGTDDLVLGTGANAGSIVFHDGFSANTGKLQLAGTLSGGTTYQLPASPAGTQNICTVEADNCGGGITGGGTINKLAKFTAAGAIGDSSISDDGATVTVAVGEVIQGSNGLTLGAGGVSGKLVFRTTNSHNLTLQSGATGGDLAFTLPTGDGGANDCLKTDGNGQLSFAACTGGPGGGVTSINTLTGVLNLNGTPNQVSIASSGGNTLTLSTPQDIAVTSNVQFRTLNVAGTSVGDNLIVANAVNLATGNLLDLKVNNSSKLTVDASGNVNTTGIYEVNGTQIASGNLADGSNLAKLNGTQAFSGTNTFNGNVVFQPASDGVAMEVKNHSGSSILAVDTSTGYIGIGNAAPGFPLDVNGDINVTPTTGVLRIHGATACSYDILSSTAKCNVQSGSNSYIQNGTSIQAGANFNIDGNGTIGGNLNVAGSGDNASVPGALFKNVTNATNAFQIQSSASEILFDADTANKRIGIGTATPGAKLDVQANTNIGFNVNQTGSNTILQLQASGTSVVTVASAGAATFTNSTNSTAAFRIQTATGAQTLFNVDTTGANPITMGSTAGTGTLTFGQSTAGETVNIANGTVAAGNTNTVNIGTSAAGTGKDVITIGTTNGASSVTLQGGTAGVTVKTPTAGTATAFQVQDATAASTLFKVDSANNNIIIGENNSGALQPWATNSTTMPNGLVGATTAIYNGYVYEVGGSTGVATGSNTTYYAKLNSDGSIGTWITSANTLPKTLFQATIAASNGYLFVMGGNDIGNNINAVANIYAAQLLPDGSVGSWSGLSNNLPQPRTAATTVVANGYVYVIGGYNNSLVLQSTVFYAPINANGTFGTWTTSSTALGCPTAGCGSPVALTNASSVVANGFVYVIGGANGSNKNTVYYGQLNASTGNISSWSTTTALPVSGLSSQSSVVANGYLYVLGGSNVANQSAVYYAKLNSDGTLGSWNTNAYDIGCATAGCGSPVAVAGQNSDVANGYIYVLGGNTGSSDSSTIYYTSTQRIKVGGSLDLVGLAGQTLNNSGGMPGAGSTGGSITAGDGTFVGNFQVQGQANFAQNVAVGNNLNVNGGTTLTSSSGSSANPAFLIQNNNAQILFTADTFGQIVTISGATNNSFASLTLTNAHFKSTQATAPTISTPTAACGTSPTASIVSGSTDSAGSFTITSGTGSPSAGCSAVITFKKPYGANPKSVLLSGANAAGAQATPYALFTAPTNFTGGTAGNGFDITIPGTVATSTAYTFYYWIIE